MKVGVITHWRGDDNYGQQLQAYALQKFLISKGYDAFLIRYFAPDELPVIDRFKLAKDFVRKCIFLFDKNRKAAYEQVQRYSHFRAINKEKNKKRKFREFQKEHLRMTECDYTSLEQLRTNPPQADAYIVGSDQVWRPSVLDPSAGAWYLQFGDNATKRISYAASIGRSITEKEREKFKSVLESFDAVSLREANAVEYFHSIGMERAKLVLDPTLLAPAEIYEPFLSESNEQPYLFLYFLNVNSAEELQWEQIQQYMQKKGLQLKSVSSSGYLPAMDLIPDNENQLLTIPEWLSAIHNARGVVTTSFHGVALSIVLHRPFVALLLNNAYSGGNVRITSLLTDLGLESRILTAERGIETILDSPIDWYSVDEKLNTKRKESEDFLLSALQL